MRIVQLFLDALVKRRMCGICLGNILDSQLLGNIHAVLQKQNTFRGFSATIETRAVSHTAVHPVDLRSTRAFESGLRLANLVYALVVLALHELPERGRGRVFHSAKLVHISGALSGPMLACYSKVRL